MPYIPWSDALKVGVETIDTQHEHLTALINRLYEAHRQGHDREILQETIAELDDYVRTHFRDEQEFMREHGYVGIESHIDQHNDFIIKSVEYLIEYSNGKEELTEEVLEYLTDWWLNHISHTDREMVRASLAG